MNDIRNRLMGALIGLARATEGNEHLITPEVTAVVAACLTATDPEHMTLCLNRVAEEKRKMVPDCFYCASPCGRTSDYDISRLQTAAPEVRQLKAQLLEDLRRLAPVVAEKDSLVIYKVLIAVGIDEFSVEELLPIAQELRSLEIHH